MLDWSNNTGSIDVKMDGSVLEEGSSFKMLGLTFPFELDWVSYSISTGKTASNKIGALIRALKFLSLQSLLWFSIHLPCIHVWNTIVISGLVPLIATWNCYSRYKNEYAGLLVLCLLLFLNAWPIIEMWLD